MCQRRLKTLWRRLHELKGQLLTYAALLMKLGAAKAQAAEAWKLLEITLPEPHPGNRQHWSIEKSCHYIIDWNYDEDRSRIRKGHGPENMTRLRRFAVNVIKSKGVRSVAQKMRELTMNTRLVFDYLNMTRITCPASAV